MIHESTEVVVLGLASGLAIARELTRRGMQVTALGRGDGVASTLTNQKWKHSGLLYTNREMAQLLWDAFEGMDPLERQHLVRRDAHFLVDGEALSRERWSMWEAWGLPFRPLPDGTIAHASELGRSTCTGGFQTPDSVMDFPSLLTDLDRDAASLGARIVSGANVLELISDGERITTVIYQIAGRQVALHCRHCVMAMGGWAAEVLGRIDIKLPIRSWKSNVLTVDRELVDRITCFLYGPGLTLVPFNGSTLIADTRRLPVADGDDRAAVPELVEALKVDIAGYFPDMNPNVLRSARVHGCIKTEFTLACTRNQELAIFGPDYHGLRNLTVALPGKASLIFTLARQVADEVTGALSLVQSVA